MRNVLSDNLQLLSLFCGPGGLDEGFRQAGFSTHLAFDIDRECVNTFNKNHAPNMEPKAFIRDLREVDADDVEALGGRAFRPIGVLGGPPCQSFSVSNVFQTDSDPRHELAFTYSKLLADLNGKSAISFFVFENVPGLLGSRYSQKFTKFKEAFENAGFRLFEKVLDAHEFGVPQRRKRMFIVGINRELHDIASFEWPKVSTVRKTVRDAIGSLPEPVFTRRGMKPSDILHHPNHWSMVPRSRKFSTDGMLSEGQGHGRSFRTLSWDKPSWTVAYGNREVHVHPSGKRRLSIYEAMLLQTFPKKYELTGNISAQVRLVSEAVPPKMALALAKAIRKALCI